MEFFPACLSSVSLFIFEKFIPRGEPFPLVFILQTHLNPCFVQASPTDDPRPLQRNSWHQLRHGDLFSLLPGRLIFQVEAVGGEGRTPRYPGDGETSL